MDFPRAIQRIIKASDTSWADLRQAGVEDDIFSQEDPSVDAVQQLAQVLDIPAPFILMLAIEEDDMAEDQRPFYRMVKRDFDRIILRFIRESSQPPE